MKISELIEKLTEFKAYLGDIEVVSAWDLCGDLRVGPLVDIFIGVCSHSREKVVSLVNSQPRRSEGLE